MNQERSPNRSLHSLPLLLKCAFCARSCVPAAPLFDRQGKIELYAGRDLNRCGAINRESVSAAACSEQYTSMKDPSDERAPVKIDVVCANRSRYRRNCAISDCCIIARFSRRVRKFAHEPVSAKHRALYTLYYLNFPFCILYYTMKRSHNERLCLHWLITRAIGQ